MILVALAVVVLGTYVPLMLAASRGSRSSRALGAVEGLLFVSGTGFAGLVALFWLGLKCDESCTEPGSPTEQAGEWWHPRRLAVGGAGGACARRAPRRAGHVRLAAHSLVSRGDCAALLGLAAFSAWALMMAPLGDQFGI
jgi:hypothetical protein